jgi:hypothetical protein
LVVNQYDKSAAEATAIFDRAAARFAEVQSKLPSVIARSSGAPTGANRQQPSSIQQDDSVDIDSLQAAADEFKSQVAQYKIDHRSRTIESIQVPRPFAAAFMAALAVVIAHMLYQMFAPETLQRMTLDEYVAYKKDDYSKHRSPDSIEEAKYYLKRDERSEFRDFVYRLTTRFSLRSSWGDDKVDSSEINNYISNLSPFELYEARQFTDEFYAKQLAKELPSRFMKQFSDALAAIDVERFKDLQSRDEFERQKNMGLIARAARTYYINAANTQLLVMILTASIYTFAIYLISSIVVTQAVSVLSAAGIDSLTSVVEWWKTTL